VRVFEHITRSPEALAAVLDTIQAPETPWDQAFRERYCRKCDLANCEPCPHEEHRNNPAWWLGLEV